MRNESNLHFHARMLADSVRMQAYESAIARVVRPGDVVVDLGTGTGILGLFAIRAGAQKVIGIDRNAWVLRQAQHLARDNGVLERMEFRRAEILELKEFDTPVDVIVSELIGHEGIDEQIFPIYEHFLKLLPRPPRALVPEILRLHAACMQMPEFRQRAEALRTACGLRMERIADALYHAHAIVPLPAAMASSPALFYEGRLGMATLPEVFSCTWDLAEPQTVDGVGLWFSSRLTEGVELTNDPRKMSTSWSQAFFPVRTHEPVCGRVHFDLWPRCIGGLPRWKWRFRAPGIDFIADPDTFDEPETLDEWLSDWGLTVADDFTVSQFSELESGSD